MTVFGDFQSFETDVGQEVYGDSMTVYVGDDVYLNLNNQHIDLSMTTESE